MKILVTGGAGFIGSHVLEKLMQEQCQVVVVDNLSSGLRENIPAGVKFIEMDICDGKLLDVFISERFDAIIHLAAQTKVPVSLERPDYDCQINILGTVNMLEACRKTEVKRVVFASTAAVYGDVNSIPTMENAETRPTSFYGLSKLTVEKYLQMYQQVYGLEYVVLRYANVYGERQGDGGEGGVVSIFIREIAQNKVINIYGDGSQTRDFIYAGDVAAANYQALVTPNVNAVYNVSTQTEVSVNSLVEVMGQVADKQLEKKYCPVREGDIYRSMLCNHAAQEKLSWQLGVTLMDGLGRTYRYLAK